MKIVCLITLFLVSALYEGIDAMDHAVDEIPEMPVLPKGPKPKNWREVRAVLEPLGYQIRRPNLKPFEGQRIEYDRVYAAYGERQMKLDLFLPENGHAPLVVLIHGGGWHSGNKKGCHNQAIWLSRRGYAAAAIEYRLSGEAQFPAAIYDCKAAIRWLRKNADKFGYDVNRIAVWGGSAGAHLAALSATAGPEADLEGPGADVSVSSAVQAGIVISGPTHLTAERIQRRTRGGDPNYQRFLGGSYDEKPDLYRQASPATWVNENTPPILFFGENSVRTFDAIRERMDDLGVPNEALALTGGIHGTWNWLPWFDVTMIRVDRFLQRTFKKTRMQK